MSFSHARARSVGCCSTLGVFAKKTGEGTLIDFYKGTFRLLGYEERCSHRNSPCGMHKNYTETGYRFWRLLTCGCAIWIGEEYANAKAAA